MLDSRSWILVIRNVQRGAVRAVNFLNSKSKYPMYKDSLHPIPLPEGERGEQMNIEC